MSSVEPDANCVRVVLSDEESHARELLVVESVHREIPAPAPPEPDDAPPIPEPEPPPDGATSKVLLGLAVVTGVGSLLLVFAWGQTQAALATSYGACFLGAAGFAMLFRSYVERLEWTLTGRLRKHTHDVRLHSQALQEQAESQALARTEMCSAFASLHQALGELRSRQDAQIRELRSEIEKALENEPARSTGDR